MATMKGDYDALLSSTLYGPQVAGPADGGGLAPYDLVRMTNTGGISEYLQVRKRRVEVEENRRMRGWSGSWEGLRTHTVSPSPFLVINCYLNPFAYYVSPPTLVLLPHGSNIVSPQQVDNVDHALDHASISTVKLSGSFVGDTILSADAGIASGKIANVYRAGGYTVKVDFTETPGNLQVRYVTFS